MTKSNRFKIRPAGRLILTIGRDLIQDPYAAVLELVKNAYDADSPGVNIEFDREPDYNGYFITVSDHGHGMTRDDVVNKWLVPATPDKLRRRRSPSGRIMQGRKGVGRYAAAVLGQDLSLQTVTNKGETTQVNITWQDFESAEFLDDVEISVQTSETSESSGTTLTIFGDESSLDDWDQKQFDKLQFELKRLKSPVEASFDNSDFDIVLRISGFSKAADFHGIIEPYPILDLFDYRIAGTIDLSGKGELEYSMQKIRNSSVEHIPFDFRDSTSCGELSVDVRVYDRDTASIGSLISRGLKDDYGAYVGITQARRLLNDYNGISVYRNGFRIRPMGDPDFDWLRLNEQRVQQPSIRIGSNQAIGFVLIQSEEQSGLIEKSARDGLRENYAFENLKRITKDVIGNLESRRFIYRRQAGLARAGVKINRELERIVSHDGLKRSVQAGLDMSGVGKETTEKILAFIDADEQEKNQAADSIRQEVAIYQGQVTLGKIVDVILHERRRPLNYFRNEIPNLRYWHQAFLETEDNEALKRALFVVDGVGDNADDIVELFGKIDPLATSKRGPRQTLNLKEEIDKAFGVFALTMESHGVVSAINCSKALKVSGWPQDLRCLFVNLIENSIYWLTEKSTDLERKISVDVETDGEELALIDYRDTGPGIDSGLIASQIIFEPQFSTKPNGTGLGLPIAGEAASRSGFELSALECNAGAWFRIQPIREDEESVE